MNASPAGKHHQWEAETLILSLSKKHLSNQEM